MFLKNLITLFNQSKLKFNAGMGCRSKETLQFLCEQIPGDALLYSMFKVDAEPIKCPIKGKCFFFFYR